MNCLQAIAIKRLPRTYTVSNSEEEFETGISEGSDSELMNPTFLMDESEKAGDQSTSKHSFTEKTKYPSIDTLLKKRTIQNPAKTNSKPAQWLQHKQQNKR